MVSPEKERLEIRTMHIIQVEQLLVLQNPVENGMQALFDGRAANQQHHTFAMSHKVIMYRDDCQFSKPRNNLKIHAFRSFRPVLKASMQQNYASTYQMPVARAGPKRILPQHPVDGYLCAVLQQQNGEFSQVSKQFEVFGLNWLKSEKLCLQAGSIHLQRACFPSEYYLLVMFAQNNWWSGSFAYALQECAGRIMRGYFVQKSSYVKQRATGGSTKNDRM